MRYEATLRVLRDLLSQGWTIREDDEGIILDAPGRSAVRLEDPEAAKESIRRSFAFAREEPGRFHCRMSDDCLDYTLRR